MVSFFFRVLCKLYEYLLRGYTVFAFGCTSDASEILVSSLSPLQQEIQNKLDFNHQETSSSRGTVLVIVPFKDQWSVTQTCLESLVRQRLPETVSLRVVLVDNLSVEERTRSGMNRAETEWPSLNIKTLRAPYAFNYSRMNNDAARAVSSEEISWVLFLNNDVELINADVIAKMVDALTLHQELGVIGSTLLYPDHAVQHLFAVPGVKIVAAHPLKRSLLAQSSVWKAKSLRVVPAVTGALMMLRFQDFKAVGMFDEEFPTLGQDIDLCLKLFKTRRLAPAVLTMDAAIHHESKTKKGGFSRTEIERFYRLWSRDVKNYALYSQRFSRWSEAPVFHLGSSEPDYPWDKVLP